MFYSRGATVWMACRSEERGRKAIADIEVSCQGTQGGGKLELLQMDISEPDSGEGANSADAQASALWLALRCLATTCLLCF